MTSGVHQMIDRQIRRWEMEAQARRMSAESAPEHPVLRPWITISRSFGSGGREIAELLSSRLNYQIFDREILEVLAQDRPKLAAMIQLLDERDRSALEVWVDGLLRGRMIDKADYLRSLARVLGSIALHGHAIIVGRGANFILDPESGLHVRIVAPFPRRIETISRLRSLTRSEAEKLVHQMDGERAAFIQRHFHRDLEDPLGYDLVLNTAALTPEACVDLVDHGLRAKLGGRANLDL